MATNNKAYKEYSEALAAIHDEYDAATTAGNEATNEAAIERAREIRDRALKAADNALNEAKEAG